MTDSRQLVRIFDPNDQRNRDAWIHSRVENDCDGCEEDHRGWVPAEGCPVHGLNADGWFAELNAELDRRWPGRWVPEREALA